MSIRMLQPWGPYMPQQIYSLGTSEEARLVGLGLADYDLDGAAEALTLVKSKTDPLTGRVRFSEAGASAVKAAVNTCTIAALGDSITLRNLPAAVSGALAYGQDGYLVQGNEQLGWPFEIVGVFGYSGQSSAYILATGVPAVLALATKPAVCVVLAGTNDAVPGGISAASPDATIANLKAIYAALMAAGIEPECCTLPPRNDAGMTTAIKRVIIQINKWIRQFARDNALRCNDFYRRLVNPTTTGTGGWVLASDGVGALLDTSGDQIHPNDYGAYLMGLEFAANHAADVVPIWRPSGPRSIAGMYVAGQTSIPDGTVVPNPQFYGTAGNVGATATGQLGNEWSVQTATLPAGAGTITLSKVAQSGSFSAWQQIAIEGGNTGANPGVLYIRSDQDYPSAQGAVGAGTWQVGDTVYGQCSFETDATNWGGTDGATPCLMYLRVQFFGASGTVTDLYCHQNGAPTSKHRIPSGVLRTPSFQVPAGTTRMYLWFGFRGKGTVRVGDADIVKVPA